MPQPPLSHHHIRRLRPGRTPVDIRDGLQRGLILTVLPSGRKQFAVRYRFRGTQRRYRLGEFPSLSLAHARKKARQTQATVDDGRDPAGERQAAKAERTDTFAALAAEYLAKHARKFKRSASEDARILTANVLPSWTDRSVRDLTRRDVRALIENIAERAPVMANRTLALVRKVLNFAIDHDWIDANPAARVKKPAPEVSRDRVLDDDEIRRLWRVLSHFPTTAQRPAPGRKAAKASEDDPICPVSQAHATLLKLRLLTAQRGGEVARMRWVDLDLEAGWWTIPGTFTKNGDPHRVPLVGQAMALIREFEPDAGNRPEYVFAVRGGTSVLDRAKKAPTAVARALRIDIRGHDLRRTAATRMAAAGVHREHISRVLNHTDGGARATRVYDRYAYDREKRQALEAWDRTLTAILRRKRTADVVPFGRR